MLAKTLLWILILEFVQAQLNGDFWWLNSQLNNHYKNARPPPPKFEVLSEFDNDESAKIVFRDNNLITGSKTKSNIGEKEDKDKPKTKVNGLDKNRIVWPDDVNKIVYNNVAVLNNIFKNSSEITKENSYNILNIHNNSLFLNDVLNVNTGLVNVKNYTKFTAIDSPGSTILFNDDIVLTNSISKPAHSVFGHKQKTETDAVNKDRVVWPDDVNKAVYNNGAAINNIQKDTSEITTEIIAMHDKKDKLVFDIYKNDNLIFNEVANFSSVLKKTVKNYTEVTKNYSSGSAILFNDDRIGIKKSEPLQSQNICTYMKKNECYENNGLVFSQQFRKNSKKDTTDTPLFCCILPLPAVKVTDDSSKIFFPDTDKKVMLNKRIKRSRSDQNKDDVISSASKQRNVLLNRKFSTQFLKLKTSSTTQTMAVTPDDEYGDPYWNIKNSNFRNPDKHNNKQTNTKYVYGGEDYFEDYMVELPKPGLVGIYSDHDIERPNWSFSHEGPSYDDADDYEDEDEDTSTPFGYSTIDPRQETKRNQNPVKLTKTSDEVSFDAASQTINFQSSPDFHVLQGFKLLNLIRNNSKRSKLGRKSTTTESIFDNESEESQGTKPLESSETIADEYFEEHQIKGCGKALKAFNSDERDIQIGGARNGSHPWLTLLVLTKRRQTILCYATLVHPRAAITAADCVDGVAPGEITLIAGLWDLNERSQARSRIVSVHVHPRFRPGEITNNLAVLQWVRPLKLGVNVQPACLAEPRVGDDCKFFGWGGFDGFRPRSRWQRASINACGVLVNNKRGGKPPSDAFCASVQSRTTVTGTGGTLICDMNGHHAAVGVVVSRDNAYMLLRAREWTLRVIDKLAAD